MDVSATTNITDDPLYVDLNVGSEDLRLRKTTRTYGAGIYYLYNSPCVGVASDGYDMGCYLENPYISDYKYRKLQIEFQPLTMNTHPMIKGENTSDDVLGGVTNWGIAHKRTFPFKFGNYTTEEMRLKIQYLNTFHPTRENELTRAETIVRLHLRPREYFATGSGVLDEDTYWSESTPIARITDTTQSFVENQHKGYHVGVKFKEVSSAVVSASGKTITKSSAFVSEDWTGYYIYLDGYYYVITSNTDDALTVADTDGTLTDQTVDIDIEKYFKIQSNDTTYLVIEDTDHELDGLGATYGYYIDFIECVVSRDDGGSSQRIYAESVEMTKSNYQYTLEEA